MSHPVSCRIKRMKRSSKNMAIITNDYLTISKEQLAKAAAEYYRRTIEQPAEYRDSAIQLLVERAGTARKPRRRNTK